MARTENIGDILKRKKAARQNALHNLQLGDVKQAVVAMQDSLKSDIALATARLNAFEENTTKPTATREPQVVFASA